MAQPVFKEAGKLAQGVLAAGNQIVHTVPAGETHMITGLFVANPTTTDDVVEYWQDGNAALNSIQPQILVKSKTRLARDLAGTMLKAGSTIVMWSASGGRLSFTLNGVKWNS